MKNEEIIKEWEEFKEEYGRYILTLEENWRSKLEKVKKFINKNNKAPKRTGNSEEKSLAEWITYQKKKYENNTQIMKNEEIRKEWEDFIEKYGRYLIYTRK